MNTIDPVQEERYNVRAAIPDHPAIFTRWRSWSDAYKAACPGARLNLAYGPGTDEVLDLFPAASPGGPLVMLIHGGYWQAMDKADNAFAARALNAAGANVAVVNHTLCPAARLEDISGQMRRAILWLWRHAAALGADPDRLYVVGHSAGGHLAAMLMTVDWPSVNGHAPADLVKGAVAVSGLFDLTALVNTTINGKVGLTPDSAVALSPVSHHPATKAPLLLAVGGDESAGFHDQARALNAAWRSFDVPIERMVLPGCNHFSAFEALADEQSILFHAVASLIGSMVSTS